MLPTSSRKRRQGSLSTSQAQECLGCVESVAVGRGWLGQQRKVAGAQVCGWIDGTTPSASQSMEG